MYEITEDFIEEEEEEELEDEEDDSLIGDLEKGDTKEELKEMLDDTL